VKKTKRLFGVFFLAGLFCTIFQLLAQQKSAKIKSAKRNCNECFYRLYDVGERYGNIKLERTPKGNFVKCSCFNSEKVVFSYGRDSVEYPIDTFDCRYVTKYPEVLYEDEDIMVLLQGCGTYCWVNTFVFLSGTKTPIKAQALYIDTNANQSLKYVDLETKNGDVYFAVHFLLGGMKYLVKSNYYRYSNGGTPEMHISNVFLRGDTVFYSIENNGKIIRDSVFYN